MNYGKTLLMTMALGATTALYAETNNFIVNTLDNPDAIKPVESTIEVSGQALNVELEAKCFAVYIIQK